VVADGVYVRPLICPATQIPGSNGPRAALELRSQHLLALPELIGLREIGAGVGQTEGVLQ
jgi:hypothetical protein